MSFSEILERLPKRNQRPMIGRVLLDKVVGRGGMGVVYSGWHLGLDIPVAVKFLTHADQHGPEAIIRFQREAKLCASLEDPNLLRVFDCDALSGVHFIIMEWVSGRNFEQITKQGVLLSENEAMTVLRDVGQALLEMHGRGIVHRDIKPANILLRARDGRIKLADLGIAASNERQEGLTQGFLGTPAYMSPEQVMDPSQVTGASDLFSLGVTLYTLLTGVTPFAGKTPFDTLNRIISQPLNYPDDLFRSVSREMVQLLRRLTAKEITERIASAYDLLTALPQQSLPFRPGTLKAAQADSQVTRPSEADWVEPAADSTMATMMDSSLAGRMRVTGAGGRRSGGAATGEPARSLLFCQCLQNDFIHPVARGEPVPNKLHVGRAEAERMVGPDPGKGPLVRVVSACAASERVGMVHIRDWHDQYDPVQKAELDFFGPHCLIGTSGARFLDVIEQYSRNRVRGAIVESSTINDFEETAMMEVIDALVGDGDKETLPVGVIGVWTNVKIHYLLYDLKTRARMHNLAVCSALVASPDRAAHQQALRHFEEVLGVRVIHGVEEFLAFLQVEGG